MRRIPVRLEYFSVEQLLSQIQLDTVKQLKFRCETTGIGPCVTATVVYETGEEQTVDLTDVSCW